MTSQYSTSTNAVTSHPTRGRHRRPRATAVASQRVLAGAALGSLMTLGTAAAPAFAGTHATSSQGSAQSDPDGMENTGADKPGGTGGVNKADQDGNNGSGNESDCEDDNNGTGTPGSCDAHANNDARTAAREQSREYAEARTSTKAHAHAGGSAEASANVHARVAATAHARQTAAMARAEIRAQVRAGTITREQAQAQLAALHVTLRSQLLAVRATEHVGTTAGSSITAHARVKAAAQARHTAAMARDQIRAQVRAGTLTREQGRTELAAVKTALETQLVALRAAATEEVGNGTATQARVEAAAHAREVAAAARAEIRAQVRAGTLTREQAQAQLAAVQAALQTQVAALQAGTTTAVTPAVAASTPAAQVLGTQFGTTPVSVTASAVPANERTATSVAGVPSASGMSAVSGVSAATLPHTGADDVAGLGALGAGSLLLGGALVAAGRRRNSSGLAAR